jgi:hypothetical protein
LKQQVHWLGFDKGLLLLEMHGTNINKSENTHFEDASVM